MRNEELAMASFPIIRLCLAAILFFTSSNLSVLAKGAPNSTAAIDSVLAKSVPLSGKVVYVDFWASWCVPCRSSFPWMKQLQDKYRDQGLQIVTINVDKQRAPADKFLADLQSPLTVVYDSSGTLAKLYDLEAMPSSFIYGRDGNLRTKHRGFVAKDSVLLDSLIGSLLKETGTK
jgi:thiol-disulfide isomerase/thioredoxin